MARVISVDFQAAVAKPAAPENPSAAPDHGPRGPAGEAHGETRRPEEEGFQFRLFSSKGAAPKIVLAGDGEGHTTGVDGDFVAQGRPLSYYVRGEAGPEEKERFRLAAVTADDVHAAAKQRNWGLEVPWKVTEIVVSVPETAKVSNVGPRDPGEAGPSIEQARSKRSRPGKKRRIALRVEEKARRGMAAVLEQQKLEKEEHLKEKRKRLNREKKLKRRQKERERKLTTQEDVAGQEDEHTP